MLAENKLQEIRKNAHSMFLFLFSFVSPEDDHMLFEKRVILFHYERIKDEIK